jgi:hypothetical protein
MNKFTLVFKDKELETKFLVLYNRQGLRFAILSSFVYAMYLFLSGFMEFFIIGYPRELVLMYFSRAAGALVDGLFSVLLFRVYGTAKERLALSRFQTWAMFVTMARSGLFLLSLNRCSAGIFFVEASFLFFFISFVSGLRAILGLLCCLVLFVGQFLLYVLRYSNFNVPFQVANALSHRCK